MAGEAVSLVTAGAEDAEAIRSLTRQAYAKWVTLLGREPLPMTIDHAEAVRKHRIDLLHMGNVPAGLIEMVPSTDHLLIENVAVLPAFQGRGLGRRLLAHAEQIAVALGYREIRLYTNKRFAENLRFYQRFGYRIDREEARDVGIAVHMSKPV